MNVKFIHLNCSIYQQLELEEALLRADEDNYVIVNQGSCPCIVMGISGKADELIHLDKAHENQIPIIKRFSGGGTVVVDENTLFVSFIFSRESIEIDPFPEPIARWSADIHKQALNIKEFSLRENDYVVGNKKVGGNAQYLRKNRWLHHSTFLWDYNPTFMQLLKQPKRAPSYRKGRSHEDFITKLCEYDVCQKQYIASLKQALKKNFLVEEVHTPFHDLLSKPYRKSLQLLDTTSLIRAQEQ